MQKNICIRRFATEPQIRGPAVITGQSSRCWMKNLQKSLVSIQFCDSTICCKEMELTTKSPLDTHANVKKVVYIYIATKPVALTKRHVVTDKFISSHKTWPES